MIRIHGLCGPVKLKLMYWALVRRRMKTWSTSSSSTCEARSGGNPTLAASQTNTILPHNPSQAIATTHQIGYNAREELPKQLPKGYLQLCLEKHCLEWLLERCEAPGCGKSGGDSFEIETGDYCRQSQDSCIVARAVGTRLRLKPIVDDLEISSQAWWQERWGLV